MAGVGQDLEHGAAGSGELRATKVSPRQLDSAGGERRVVAVLRIAVGVGVGQPDDVARSRRRSSPRASDRRRGPRTTRRTADTRRGCGGWPGPSGPRIRARRGAAQTAWPPATSAGPTAECAVTISRLDSGASSKPQTWPNAYAGVCRLPQLWLTLPVQPSTTTRTSSSSSWPSNCASGCRTIVLAVGNRALYPRSVSSLTKSSAPGVIRRSQRADRFRPVTHAPRRPVVHGGRPDPGGPGVIFVVRRTRADTAA